MKADKTYDNVVKGSLKIKGKAITKKKKTVDVEVTKPKDVIVVEKTQTEPQVVPDDDLQKKIQRVIANDSLTPSEKTFRIVQLQRNAKKIEDQLKKTHRERVEIFNQKLSKLSPLTRKVGKMSTATFLGTPLSKYEIDDIETDLVHKRAQNFEKSKELKYRQNREQIKRNQIITHYTVDTAEGFVPANFKSSKTNRASYKQQEVSTFTDLEDAEITTKNTLKAIKIDRIGLRRNVATILATLGFMGKKRFIGPINIHAPQTRISSSLEGVGFTFDVDKGVGKLQFVNATNDDYGPQWRHHAIQRSTEQMASLEGAENYHVSPTLKDGNAKETAAVSRHVQDRQFDLAEIQFYYQHLYNLIVKPMEVTDDLVEKIEKGIEFASEGIAKEKVVETGRKVELYTFDDELLQKFRIRTKRTKDDSANIGGHKMDDGTAPTAKLPSELFRRIFGK
ncbi:hypothetical protein, conserved [Babesia bigemina]|uniref:G patch domain-containing protein n=1 Tax=Babesia bigemina TaxID=5866 RepID=A0A061D8G2_BABBI|nr:hypothetical protein, conserved [Babesia bigemina]CDR96262.1 hypothetical protein, conserved [Babesia bigemina]|eukprot:XP_012768448.1 hypothetical protein, conserved [Babesia bigemina]